MATVLTQGHTIPAPQSASDQRPSGRSPNRKRWKEGFQSW